MTVEKQEWERQDRIIKTLTKQKSELQDQICEMQLLIDQASEKLKVHFTEVIPVCDKCGSEQYEVLFCSNDKCSNAQW